MVTHGYSSEYGPDGRVSWPGYEGMKKICIPNRSTNASQRRFGYAELYTHLSRIPKGIGIRSAPDRILVCCGQGYPSEAIVAIPKNMPYGSHNYRQPSPQQPGFLLEGYDPAKRRLYL